jgi:hypothetical protein
MKVKNENKYKKNRIRKKGFQIQKIRIYLRINYFFKISSLQFTTCNLQLDTNKCCFSLCSPCHCVIKMVVWDGV